MATTLQGDALDLHVVAPRLRFQQEIQPAVLKKHLGLHGQDPRLQAHSPFAENLIGRLGVHIHQPLPLPHSNKVIGRFSSGVCPSLQPDLHAALQQLSAAAGILHMADHLLPPQTHMGYEPIGPRYELRRQNFSVSHQEIFLRNKYF